MKVEVLNSYCKVINSTDDINKLIAEVLTYKSDISAEKGQLFYQLKRAKQYNNKPLYFKTLKALKYLEETEYVCWFKNNTFPTGHLNIVLDLLKELNINFDLVDQRFIPDDKVLFRWNNIPYNPRYYQQDMINLGLQHGRGVFESAVGTGKSLVLAYLIYELSVKSLVIVPSTGLSQQLYNEFRLWFGSKNVQLVDASKVRKSKDLAPIRIITIQSLTSLQKTGDIQALISDVNALFVDEIHHAGSDSYTNLLPDMEHIYYRFGCTGTFLRNDSKTLDMWGFLSNVLYKYPAHKAIEEGYLTPIEVHIHELMGKNSRNYQKEYDMNYCDGNIELLEKVKNIILEAPNGDQILILVNKKDKCGKIIHEFLNHFGLPNSYISGDNSKEEITETIISFNSKDINILIGSSVIGEGIDVRSTDHLIMCQGGKSEIVMVQAVGRAIRLFEGKKKAYVHDFKFQNTRYLQKHLDVRSNIYDRNFECPINYVS